MKPPLRTALILGSAALLTIMTASLSPAPGSSAEAPLRAGAAASNITPKLGTSINGGMQDRRAQHVHDELHARCLVLDDRKTRLAIAVCDSCMLPRELTDEARRLVHAETEIPPGNILISATHAHSCGTCAAVFQSEPDADYPRFVARRIADGIRRAVNNLAPARIAWGSGRQPDEVFNRRWKMKPGTIPPNPFGGMDRVKMNPTPDSPDLIGAAGPTDPEVSIVSVRSTAGLPIALLANYSLHYVGGTGPGHISADYFGMFADRVQEMLRADRQDSPFVGIMSNGTSGDINNINFRVPGERLPPYAKMRQVAEKLAAEAVRVEGTLKYRNRAPLAAVQTDLNLRVRKPEPAEVRRAKEILAKAPPGELKGLEEIYAHETLQLVDYPAEVSLMLQALRIGDLAISAIPCEVFVETGLELKRRSPVRPQFTISLANGYNGYLPTPDHHVLGGYETWRAKSSYLEVAASRKITDRMLELLGELKGR